MAGVDVFSLCLRLLWFSVVGEETLVSVFHGSSYVSCAEKSLSLCSNYLVMFPVAGDYLCVLGAYPSDVFIGWKRSHCLCVQVPIC